MELIDRQVVHLLDDAARPLDAQRIDLRGIRQTEMRIERRSGTACDVAQLPTCLAVEDRLHTHERSEGGAVGFGPLAPDLDPVVRVAALDVFIVVERVGVSAVFARDPVGHEGIEETVAVVVRPGDS